MEKMNMKTTNTADENYETLLKMFPNAISETINENGRLVRAIDVDVLRQEISCELVEGNSRRYQFTWPDKNQAIINSNQSINKTLRIDRNKSVGKNGEKGSIDSENIYIEGDNLDSLKLLQETYLNKIKMIYIDPPYNTGNDFVYEDDFSQDIAEYIGNSGQIDEYGNRLVVNSETNGRYHTNWINMMYPRLRVARNLLKEDGVIFISIDDVEVANLRKICDEIFGSNNFVADLIWQKKFSRANDATYFSTMHDHILCYCKSNCIENENGWKIGLIPRGDEIPAGYSNPDNDPRGVWTSVVLSAKSGSESLLYEITTPSGRIVTPPSGRYWSCSQATFEAWKADGRIWFGSDGNGTPRKKTFLSEVQNGLRPNTILFHGEVGHNQEAKQETKALFNGIGVFDGPKPVRLLQTLLTIANVEEDDIVLDFFSGSATTAHAVYLANAKENKKIKFILVQIPEIVAEKTEAYKAGYKTICEIGEERIKLAGDKIRKEENADIDYGFRVFYVDSSNMKDVYYKPDTTQQTLMDFLSDNIKEERTSEDLLFQVMLDLGVFLSSKIEETEIAGKNVFSVADDFLIACFDTNVTEETVKAIAAKKPYYAVLRDSSMANDSVATNFDQIFETISPETVRKVL